MDWLQFTSTTLGQILSWPVAAIVLAILFRRSIGTLLQKLQSWKNGPAGDFEFGQGIGKVETAVDNVVNSIGDRVSTGTDLGTDGHARQQGETGKNPAEHDMINTEHDAEKKPGEQARWSILASSSNPSYLILSSWEKLNEAVRDLGNRAQRAGRIEQMYPTTTPLPIVHELSQYGIVNRDFVDAFQQLRSLRNKVAHGQHNPTAGESLAYADSVEELTKAVAILGNKLDLRANLD